MEFRAFQAARWRALGIRDVTWSGKLLGVPSPISLCEEQERPWLCQSPASATRKLLRIISTNPESIPEENGREMNSGPARSSTGSCGDRGQRFLLIATSRCHSKPGFKNKWEAGGRGDLWCLLIPCFTSLFPLNFIPTH